MNDTQLTTFAEIRGFLAGTVTFDFTAKTTQETYTWVQNTLLRFGYGKLEKKDKTLVKAYLQKVTGYSRSQMTRLIHAQTVNGRVVRKRSLRHVFTLKFTTADIALLAHTDDIHDNPNGKTIKCILEREYSVYKKQDYRLISTISVGHIYNLRKTTLYRRINTNYQHTHPTATPIGERCAPQPFGSPGFIRVDTVHQGDKEKEKGVYHIHLVDEVTQFDFMGAVETISESHLIPMLEQLINAFPFVIKEIHADNGSEYINQYVARLLQKLVIRLTKSRPRHSNDNALVESKNGSVIRKWIGYSFLPKGYAKALNTFYFGCLHEYLNYHHPCAFPKVITNKKGKQKKTYPQENYLTPFGKFKSLPNASSFLKIGCTMESLEQIATHHSDNEMATIVQTERSILFNS